VTAQEFDKATNIALQDILDHLKELVESAETEIREDLLLLSFVNAFGYSVSPSRLSQFGRFVAAERPEVRNFDVRLHEIAAQGLIPIVFMLRRNRRILWIQVAHAHYIPEGLSKGGEA
jgi:hypothetical protein